ncbi:transglutaminase family protein [Oscillochloris sp. ZM17-4]|uniref:transglutaminase-like domain-containing protein n=1 Tax=Oscillochloris sp. ZM17-4 TaxID=2866714 RepID=UPI001C73D21C|nr:transglutaminase family protein [Oscillochloris sp. ZM17-4]MBX0326423.1 transglutaminase family protein [Oscillochloris sp. ZM17-4]
MLLRVGFTFVIESGSPTPVMSVVRPRQLDIHRLIDERHITTPQVPIHTFHDSFNNTVWRWTTPAGTMQLSYDAIVEVPATPDPAFPYLPGAFVDQLPDDVMPFTLPSRYCPSDLVLNDAWAMFGGAPDGWARVQAICDWAHATIAYGYGNSTPNTTGYDAYMSRRGVCRDFAHVGVMFCRAMNIPARYVSGYLPDIGVPIDPNPMDFHAWFEAYVGGAWRTFDARHNRPRIGRVVIARGRDAVDTAILTSYGDSQLTGMAVWADELHDRDRFDVPLWAREAEG